MQNLNYSAHNLMVSGSNPGHNHAKILLGYRGGKSIMFYLPLLRRVLFAMVGFGVFHSKLSAATYYVAPEPVGSDTNDGRSLLTPLARINTAANKSDATLVVIRGGIYRETVTPGKSGIDFSAYNNEAVTISGADPVTGWNVYSGNAAGGANGNGGGKIYTANATTPTLNNGFDNQLFVDGLMMIEARSPNNPRCELLNPPMYSMDSAVNSTISVAGAQTSVVYDALLTQPTNFWVGAIMHRIGSDSGTNVSYGMGSTDIVTGSASGSVTLDITAPSTKAAYVPGAGSHYYLSGLLKLLDSPGEWFRDLNNNIYLWTPLGDAPLQHSIEIKNRYYGFDLGGRSQITLTGIRFFACTIKTDLDSSGILLDQLDIVYPGYFSFVSSVYDDGVASVFRDGSFSPNSGVYLTGKNNIIQNSSIAYSAGTAVSVGGLNNKVVGNLIHDVAYNGTDGAGVTTGFAEYNIASTEQTTGAEIGGNTIYNSSRALLQVRGSYAGDIHHNNLWYGMMQTYDYGAIYALNSNTGGGFTRIHHNRVHDMKPPTNPINSSNSIYIDNNSHDYVVDHNITWGAGCGFLPTSTYKIAETGRCDLDVATSKTLNFSGGFTFALWIQPVSTTGLRYILRRGPQGNHEIFFRINEGYYECGSTAINAGSTMAPVRLAIAPADVGAWVHFAGVYTGTQWLLYKNGVLAGTGGADPVTGQFDLTNADTTTYQWTLAGAQLPPELVFDGYMDDFRMYSAGLTAGDLASLAAGTLTTPSSAALWLSFENYQDDRNVVDADNRKNSDGSSRMGRLNYANSAILSKARPPFSTNRVAHFGLTGYTGMLVFNNNFDGDSQGAGYGSTTSASMGSPDPQSNFSNNIFLNNTTLLYYTAVTPKKRRAAPSLIASTNITTYGKSGDDDYVASPGFVNEAGHDYHLGASAYALAKGTSASVRVPDTTRPISAGAYPTKLIAITTGSNPDLGAYEGGDWSAGAIGLSTGSLPYGWNFQDIGVDGTVSPTGYTAFVGNNYYVTGGGSGITGDIASFHYASTIMAGDGEISARLLQQELPNQSPAATSGLMLRYSNTPTAPYVAISATAAGVVRLDYRTTNPPAPTVTFATPIGTDVLAPNTTHTLVANASCAGGAITQVVFRVNGAYLAKSLAAPYAVTWTPAAAGAYSLTAQAYNNLNVTSTATLAVNVMAGPTTPTVAIIAPAAGFISPVNTPMTVSANADVVSGTISQVVFRANGTYLGKAFSAPYTIIWTPTTSGSYSITADVFDSTTPTALTKRSVSVPVTVVNPLQLPLGLKLIRTGSQVTGMYSADGVSWTSAGSVVQDSLGGSPLAGLAVSTSNNQLLTTSIFGSVQINGYAAPLLQTGLNAWLEQIYPSHADTSPFINEKLSGDSIPNLLRYAFGIQPNVLSNPADLPQVGLTAPDQNSRRYVSITFARQSSPVSGISYIVEQSTDLSTWTTVNQALYQVGPPQDLGGGLNAVTVRSTMPVDPATPKVFMRVRVGVIGR